MGEKPIEQFRPTEKDTHFEQSETSITIQSNGLNEKEGRDEKEKLKNEILDLLSEDWISVEDICLIEEILSDSNNKYLIHQSEIQNAAKKAIIKQLENAKNQFNKEYGNGDSEVNIVARIKNALSIPKEIFYSQEIQQHIPYEVKSERKLLELLDPENSNRPNDVMNAVRRMQVYRFPQEFIQSPEMQRLSVEALKAIIDAGWYGDYAASYEKDVIEVFSINDETLKEIVEEKFADSLSRGADGSAIKLKEAFSIDEQRAKNIAMEKMFVLMESENSSNLECALRIRKQYGLDIDLIKKYLVEKIEQQNWKQVITISKYEQECTSIYKDFLSQNKELATNSEVPFSKRRGAFDILSGLAENGESSISEEFSGIIKKRSKQKEIPESRWGLDPIQESAFYTLMRLDVPESNEALFNLLLNENVNLTVKYAVLRKLSSKHRDFLNENSRQVLHDWQYSSSIKELDWQDLQFVGEMLKIPSKELRDKSLKSLSVFKSLDFSVFPLYKTWSEKYSNIPQNVFLQILELDLACESEGLLDKFQKLFTSIRKESSKKDSLLYGITNVLETDPQILKLVGEKLSGINLGSKQDADSMSELLRRIVFLNRIENIKNYQDDEDDRYERDEDYEEQEREKQLPPEIAEIFSKETKTLNSLVALIKEVATKKFQEILPNENITAEKIEAIEIQWGDLEPIFTYLGRFPSLKGYVAEIVANIDTEEGWKNWRYDLKNEGVQNQIGHLSEEQLEIWKGDYFSEIGDIMVAETGSDKPKQIQRILREAVLQHRHIFNPEMGQNRNEFIQKTLEGVFAETDKTPDKQSEIIEREIHKILADSRSIDAIINFNNLPRLRQGVDLLFSAGPEISPSSKIKNTVGFISSYLPKELRKVLEDNYSVLEDQKKMAVDSLFTPQMREAIEQKAREVEEDYHKTLDLDIWERFQLDKNNLKNLEQFYQKRQEFKSATDLLRLLNLSNKLIATNRIAEKEGKKGGETIASVLERLKKYFKDSPLLQDVSNVEFILKEKIDFGEKRRLAMIFTDNAQMLWQAGKYPLGNGSCQHYAEGSYANQLIGYVGDSNCKVVYLIDLNRLPQGIRSEIEEKGFEEFKDEIPKQELLNASLARSIIKMTRDREKEPVILMEPTYTVVYKGDVSMDRYFNLFVDLMVAEPMRAKMARGGGNESVLKGRSLSPEGQYEDLNLNSVKFIHKLSKPTKEEMEVMERIRSSR